MTQFEPTLAGNHVLITGGTGGLGMGVSQAALAQGAHLTIPFRQSEEVERLRQQLTAEQLEQVTFLQADLTDEATVIRLVSDLPRLDALIHLVGGFSMGPTAEVSYSDWKQATELNLHTTFLMCKHSLPKMQAQQYGRIVTIGSRGAVAPAGQLAAYCASKAAVVALTQSIADEMKGQNITANSVLPSMIDTPGNRAAMGAENADQWVKPASLAQIICFLASAAAQDIRGAAVPAYGNL